LIEVRRDPFVGVYGVGSARIDLGVSDVWGEVVPTEGNLQNF
jgi:hypothetical protein